MIDRMGDRMKAYENVNRTHLIKRIPVIIRVDGKAFHTLTKHFKKPFDSAITEAMNYAAIDLLNELQGCKAVYVQSDEISLLVTDYDTLETAAWFDYNVQKITSIAASIATSRFTEILQACTGKFYKCHFDARAFNIPREDAVNYFLWRFKDCKRNAINSFAQSIFSHKQLQGKSLTQVEAMILNAGHKYNVEVSERNRNGMLMLKNDIGSNPLKTDLQATFECANACLGRFISIDKEMQ